MKNENILLTGCGGMLGSSMYGICLDSGANVLATDIDLNESWLEHADVRDIHECEKVFRSFKPTITIHMAALTDLEFCEQHQDDAWKTNALGTENIALLCKKYNSLMVYISTAGIFDGKKDVYNDFDMPNPLSYYAKSKYHGELFVERFLERYFIFRAGWMMGGGPLKDKKFINKIYKQIQAGATELFVVDDKLGNPTYTRNFAESILKVIPTEYYGLYNQTCLGNGSRHDVAQEFIRLLGLVDKIKVTKISSDYFKDEYFAPRPYSEKLENLKLTMRNINFMKNWQECLAEYSSVFREDYEQKI